MLKAFSLSLSVKSFQFTLFLFFGLLILSTAFFVFADETTGTKNIFQDSDQDGLSNEEEALYGTNPSAKDTDGDGYSDGIEVESGYNPLQAAPGDKIIKESAATSDTSSARDSENLTQKVSSEIVSIMKSTDKTGQAVSLEDINGSVERVLSGNTEPVVLPDVDINDIKIKVVPKNFKENKRAEQEKEDAIEYLTVMAYLMSNNAPRTFQTEDDLSSILMNLSSDSIAALTSGNMEYIDQLSKRGEKMLEELKDVTVPEKMLDVHVKALKMAKYAMQLKGEFTPSQEDPLGQIAALSKAQGFFGVVISFIDEIQGRLLEYGIKEIPLSL